MFSTREIMTKAWTGYRKMARIMREVGFNRAPFRSELVLAWAAARAAIAKPVVRAAAVVVQSVFDPTKAARVSEIRNELQWMEMGDRINWDRHRELSDQLREVA